MYQYRGGNCYGNFCAGGFREFTHDLRWTGCNPYSQRRYKLYLEHRCHRAQYNGIAGFYDVVFRNRKFNRLCNHIYRNGHGYGKAKTDDQCQLAVDLCRSNGDADGQWGIDVHLDGWAAEWGECDYTGFKFNNKLFGHGYRCERLQQYGDIDSYRKSNSNDQCQFAVDLRRANGDAECERGLDLYVDGLTSQWGECDNTGFKFNNILYGYRYRC